MAAGLACTKDVRRRKLFALDVLHRAVHARVGGQVGLHVLGELLGLGARLGPSKAASRLDAAHFNLHLAGLVVQLLLDGDRDGVLTCNRVSGSHPQGKPHGAPEFILLIKNCTRSAADISLTCLRSAGARNFFRSLASARLLAKVSRSCTPILTPRSPMNLTAILSGLLKPPFC